MTEILIELFSEEIPAGAQRSAAIFLRDQILANLEKLNITDLQAQFYFSPRRLTIAIDGIPKTVKTKATEVRGPKISAPEQAVNGFVRKMGLADVAQLSKRKIKNDSYYCYIEPESKLSLLELLPDLLIESFNKLSSFWPKTMRWGEYQLRWMRPLHNIAVIFGGDIVKFNYFHLSSNNSIFAHRLLNSAKKKVKNFAEYKQFLNNNHVVFDHQVRRDLILTSLLEKVKEENLELILDEDLLDEVTGLVEYPNILMGEFSADFLRLPKEALISVMKKHQRYFALTDQSGYLANKFLFVANMDYKNEDPKVKESVIIGNEYVLTARFNDAKFFFQHDQNIQIIERVKKLDQIIYHRELGSLGQKVAYTTALAKFISVFVPHSDLLLVERASLLCKCDLTTNLVEELPELQGVAGYYYALKSGEVSEVAVAIRDHYMPIGSKGEVPTDPITVSVALADKINSLVALFVAGERPSGSKDPYALRRLAIAIINIILENKLNISLAIVIEYAVHHYTAIIKQKNKAGISGIFKNQEADILKQIIAFIMERFHGLMNSRDITSDFIDAVYDDGTSDDLYIMYQKAKILVGYMQDDEFMRTVSAYKRAFNIYKRAEEDDKKLYNKKLLKISFKHDVERDLFDANKILKDKIQDNIKIQDYQKAFNELRMIVTPVEIFFDEIMVNDPEPQVRENRLKLLATLCTTVNKLANLSYLKSK
ncbi:MAG: glycine--tRNA ligase subunit beta [Rickettsiales bacterium]|jgi:glycyl-tRNA synthetase beta chain|nr:glycine--tRNA ligase subunit beta [Rickettsiales bacterium]